MRRCLCGHSHPCMCSFLKVVGQEVTSVHLPESLAFTKGFPVDDDSLQPLGGLLPSWNACFEVFLPFGLWLISSNLISDQEHGWFCFSENNQGFNRGLLSPYFHFYGELPPERNTKETEKCLPSPSITRLQWKQTSPNSWRGKRSNIFLM